MQAIKNNAMEKMVQSALAQASKPDADVVVLDNDAFARIGNLVNGWIESEDLLFEGDTKAQACALGLAKHFGTNPSYEFWNATAKAWQSAYLQRVPSANEESTERAWQRLCKRLAKECGLEKPKAPSADAKRMSEKRAQEKAELEKLADSALLDLVAEFKAKDDFKNAEKYKKEIDRREKEKTKGVAEQVKIERDAVVALVKKCTDIATLRKVKAMLSK